ncbi:MAG: hypothetical protein PHE09_14245 [Oscillospiraceae bacterium]|nr:hypothetical protein [Oscillospiraceae bacterium]
MSKRIRFIDSHYKELFSIRDGGSIKITGYGDEISMKKCRFLDECHTEVGSTCYHICQFAEVMEKNGYKYEPAEMEVEWTVEAGTRFVKGTTFISSNATDAEIEEAVRCSVSTYTGWEIKGA